MHLSIETTEGGEMITTTAASAADAIRARFATTHCPTRVTIVQSLCMGMCSIMAGGEEVAEFLFDAAVAKAVCANREALALNTAEWSAIVALCCTKLSTASMVKASKTPEFSERIRSAERALQWTLKEEANASKWKHLPVKVAVALCFHTTEPPFPALNAVFGSIVGSDERMCEDLHSSIQDETLDTLCMAAVVEAVSESVLL